MGQLLAFAALYDNRKVGDPDVIAWLEAIGDLPYADARTAVAGHYGSETTERIMPGHIRTRVKAMRRERIERFPIAAPAPELTDHPAEYRQALRGNLKRVADGFSISRAVGELPSATPPPVAEVRKALGPAIPPAERNLPPEEIARRQAAESRAIRGQIIPPEAETGDPAA
jgi:hypothetical protein